METNYGITGVREAVREARAGGATVALVPTMGNLHGGHLELVARATAACDFTVVSIFVNPAQFGAGAGDDFESYPRSLEADVAALSAAGVDYLFAPTTEAIYPDGVERCARVEVPRLGDILCGEFRPGFFRGVCTVVCVLLNRVQPDQAFFGEKDYQQLVLIRRMVRDLQMPVTIVPVPTVREPDGLALSSRNAYLDAGQRARAPALHRRLCEARDAIESGRQDYARLEQRGMEALARDGLRPEYFCIRRSSDLEAPAVSDRDVRILSAAVLGRARLIDNVAARAPGRGP